MDTIVKVLVVICVGGFAALILAGLTVLSAIAAKDIRDYWKK